MPDQKHKANNIATNIKKLQKLIDESDNIVFFGGAVVLTESGIKDFRGKNGLYKMKQDPNYSISPEYMLRIFNGKHLVIINDTPTPYDDMAKLVINKPSKEVFGKLR